MSTQEALFAGGCFWGMQELFRKLNGVIETEVGYTGGQTSHPTYDDVKSGGSGHAEALRLVYNDNEISYEELLKFFFRIHDPSTVDQQGNDRGSQYRSAIFYHNDAQKQIAQAVIKKVNASGEWPGKVVTQLVPAEKFTPAESFHQDYLQRYPTGYTCHFIRKNWKL